VSSSLCSHGLRCVELLKYGVSAYAVASDDGPGSDAGAGDDDAVGDESADGEAWAMRGHAVAAVAMTSSPHSAGSTGTALTSTTGLCFFD
jgi:hypothetical protein